MVKSTHFISRDALYVETVYIQRVARHVQAVSLVLAGAESWPFALQQLVFGGHHGCLVFSKLVTTSQRKTYLYMTLTQKCFGFLKVCSRGTQLPNRLASGLCKVVTIGVMANRISSDVIPSSTRTDLHLLTLSV